jgi:hypothetical protein
MSELTPQEAREAVLAGKVVKMRVGEETEDPVLLNYVDRTYEFDYQPMIFSEAIGGWSEGIKEAVCELDSDFYLEFVTDVYSLTLTDDEPLRREQA